MTSKAKTGKKKKKKIAAASSQTKTVAKKVTEKNTGSKKLPVAAATSLRSPKKSGKTEVKNFRSYPTVIEAPGVRELKKKR